MKWRRNTSAKQRQSESQRRAAGVLLQPTWKCCRHMKFIAPFFKELGVTSLGKGSASCTSQEISEFSAEELQRRDDWMTPLDSEMEEDGAETEQRVARVNGESKSLKSSKRAASAHDNSVDTEGNAQYPSSSSSSLALSPSATPVCRRPGQRRKRLKECSSNCGRGFVGDNEADEMFFVSLLPYFRRLSYKKRSALKIQILQLVYAAVFE